MQEGEINKCLEYFREIIETQEARAILKIGAHEVIRTYEHENLTQEELRATLSRWSSGEDELRKKGIQIYNIAYREKCFEDLGPQ